MPEAHARITIDRISVELTGDPAFVEAELARWREWLMGQVAHPPTPLPRTEGVDDPPRMSVRTKITLREFFELKKPHKDVDRVLLTGYFIEKYEHRPCFDRQDIAALLGQVQSVPDHLDGYIQDNLRKGYFLENRDGEKPLSLTYSGEMFVKGGLED